MTPSTCVGILIDIVLNMSTDKITFLTNWCEMHFGS